MALNPIAIHQTLENGPIQAACGMMVDILRRKPAGTTPANRSCVASPLQRLPVDSYGQPVLEAEFGWAGLPLIIGAVYGDNIWSVY